MTLGLCLIVLYFAIWDLVLTIAELCVCFTNYTCGYTSIIFFSSTTMYKMKGEQK